MASKKAVQLPTAHTAGIFADLSVDGPIIGTLVAIVDRAKNLPNRKTIGKQDPYCAARLGKEAKKTSTDIRGGQTPKWDQELRFTVHDSPDYYQLKISVFTDDKKTDLIGEAWVDLKSIIIPGGGQNDIWQSLTCKGKYAGEIRVEITFYDSRPKPEKPAVKARHSTAADLESTPPKHKTPMKRRPLPSDPITGEAPPINNTPVTPDYHQTLPRHAKQPSHSSHVPSQSPLQSVEYGLPASSHHRQQSEQYPPTQSTPPYIPSQDSYRQPEPHDLQARQYDAHHSPDPRASRSSLPEVYDLNPRDSRHSLPPDDARPPPPPAHRSRHNSSGQNNFETSPTKMPMRHDVLRNEAHRNSAPSYPGQPTYRGFDSAPPANYQPFQPPEHELAAPRHHSHDGTHETHYRTMQPTVEDAPDSPTGQPAFRQSGSRRPHPDEMGYGSAASPAPLNVSRSPVASPHHVAVSPMQTPGIYDHPHGSSAPVSPLASRDFSTSPGHRSYHPQNHYASQRREPEPGQFQSSGNYSLPALPASLVPGVDPALSQEITDRIYEERRGEPRYTSQISTPPRGRQQSEPATYGHGGGASPHGYQAQGYERRSGISYGGADNHSHQHRQQRHSVSPVPPAETSHTIRRKSVSPIPPSLEERRSSEIPFSPDDYNAFNPALQSSREATPMGDMPEAGGKIITHDGKEVDPSDHLPVESWAPEPEPKQPSAPMDARSRPMPGGAQPMPPSGRKQLRITRAQPQPAPSPSAGYNFSSDQQHTPPPQVSAGRNRLHKRTNRGSALPSPAASSPLAPISPDNYQDRQGGSPYTPTRGLPRAHTWDYPNENHSPHHQGQNSGYGPPLPAKVPLMSGANLGLADERSLAEEMQSIDIGAGRSRRRGGY